MKRVIRGTLTLPFFFFFLPRFSEFTRVAASLEHFSNVTESPLHARVYFINIFNFVTRSDSSLFIYFWNVSSFICRTHRLFQEYHVGIQNIFQRVLKFDVWMFLEIIIFKRILEFWLRGKHSHVVLFYIKI